MKILQIIFEGYNKKGNSFADCALLMQEQLFSTKYVYEISLREGYAVVSEIQIYLIEESRCKDEGEEFWLGYEHSVRNGFFFVKYIDKKTAGFNPFKVPRFSEKDFENMIVGLGGQKIPESTIKTPDFVLNEIVYELKDMQSESLYNKERQKVIGAIFESLPGRTINLNPKIQYGTETDKYHQLIKNTIQGHFKKASAQIKSYKSQNKCTSAGIILLNTGMFSLPHELLEKFVEDILRNTSTIEFVLIFSQIMQGTWLDLYAVYGTTFIGKSPPESEEIKQRIETFVYDKMTAMARGYAFESIIDSMHPISFEENNKVFYWNPGRVKPSFEKED